MTDFSKKPSRADLRDALDPIQGTALVLIRNQPGPDDDPQYEALAEWVAPIVLPRVKLGTAEIRQSSELPDGVLVRVIEAPKLPPKPAPPAAAAPSAEGLRKRGKAKGERVIVTAEQVGKVPDSVVRNRLAKVADTLPKGKPLPPRKGSHPGK